MWNDNQKLGFHLNSEAECTPRPQAPLFSPFFSGKTEKKGPPEARQKRLRRNESLQARLLILCARFFLSKPQTEFAVWVFSMQICNNLSVSAAPSQLPWKGSQGGVHRRRFSALRDNLSVCFAASIPTPFVPAGHFPLIGGIGPWEGSPWGAQRGGVGSPVPVVRV